MFATFISIIAVVALEFGMCVVPGFGKMIVIPECYFEFFFLISLFLSLLPWGSMLYISQGSELQAITIAALRSNLGDKKLYGYSAGIFVVSLLGIFSCFQAVFPSAWSFAFSLLCVGILLDLIRMSYCRFQYRRTPEGLAEWFSEVMLKSVKKRDETWHGISYEAPFSMMAVYMKFGSYGSLRLFCQAIAETSDLWLGSLARIVMYQVPLEFEECILDRYSSAETKTVKRISWLLQEACAQNSRPGLEEITRLAGKLYVSFHVFHESLGKQLLEMLLQISQDGLGKMRVIDLDMEVFSTFFEILKSLVDRSVSRNEFHAPAIQNILEIIKTKSNEIFLREKDLNPLMLVQPLAAIERMLEWDRYKSLRGKEEIVTALRRTIGDISILCGVPVRLSEQEGGVADTKSTFRQDRLR